MQTTNGELKLLKQTMLESNYMAKVLDVLKSGISPKDKFVKIREVIVNSKVKHFDHLYRYLYDHLDEFTTQGTKGKTILEIAKAMREDPMCTDKEVNVMAMIVEIINI
jgi:predicted SAM-dependent methyltransferase